MAERSQRDRALDALRTWRRYNEDRDPLVLAADAAGASQSAIAEASGLARNTVNAILKHAEQENPVPTNTTAADPLAGLHHPNLLSARPTGLGYTEYTWRSFTGHEPEPKVPDEADQLPYETTEPLHREYRAAWHEWAKAKHKLAVRPAIESAAPAWQAWKRAESALEAAYAAFVDLEDGKWRSALLRLADAQHEAADAAETWDQLACGLARLDTEQMNRLGDNWTYRQLCKHLAADFGIDASAWRIGDLDDYRPYSRRTLAYQVGETIADQKQRLREVAALAGDPQPR